MKTYLFLLIGLFGLMSQLIADDLKEPYKQIMSQRLEEAKEDESEDEMFSGITMKQGDTMIKSGTTIPVNIAALRDKNGRIPPEVLPYLERSVIYSSAGDASVSVSETHSSSAVGVSSSGVSVGVNSNSQETNTQIPSGVKITKHE